VLQIFYKYTSWLLEKRKIKLMSFSMNDEVNKFTVDDEGEVFTLINDVRGFLLGVVKCGEEIEGRRDPLNQDPDFNAIMTLCRTALERTDGALSEVAEKIREG
jgi:hypothetical protein